MKIKYKIGDIVEGQIYYDSGELVKYLIEDVIKNSDHKPIMYYVRDLECSELVLVPCHTIDDRYWKLA